MCRRNEKYIHKCTIGLWLKNEKNFDTQSRSKSQSIPTFLEIPTFNILNKILVNVNPSTLRWVEVKCKNISLSILK